jgi:hypothetical protein
MYSLLALALRSRGLGQSLPGGLRGIDEDGAPSCLGKLGQRGREAVRKRKGTRVHDENDRAPEGGCYVAQSGEPIMSLGRGLEVGSRIELAQEIAKVADFLEGLLAVLGSAARCEDEIQKLLTHELSVLRVPSHRPQQLLLLFNEGDNGAAKVRRGNHYGEGKL